jgi:hypothetical protein
VPDSCTGMDCDEGGEGVMAPEQLTLEPMGKSGYVVSEATKLKADVKSPQTCRRQALMVGFAHAGPDFEKAQD